MVSHENIKKDHLQDDKHIKKNCVGLYVKNIKDCIRKATGNYNTNNEHSYERNNDRRNEGNDRHSDNQWDQRHYKYERDGSKKEDKELKMQMLSMIENSNKQMIENMKNICFREK